jgi:rhodanese-related sulfurtransferase
MLERMRSGLRRLWLLSPLVLPLVAQAADPASLRSWISLRYPGVAWVDTHELARWLEGESPPILLDARSEEEFAVSHLSGARRVDPEATAEELPELAAGARAVVYCSVGYRSAAIARRLRKAGHRDVYNLEGGIFAWANEGRELRRGDARVRVVHPYTARWGRYLDPRLHATSGTAKPD